MVRGILYICAGSEYVEEACMSARSLKQIVDIPITLVTDQKICSPYIDTVIPMENPKRDNGDDVDYISESPYDETLRLDTDTIIKGNISELFTLLERFDIAASHAPNRGGRTREGFPVEGVPDSFPEYNGGVILFGDNPRVDDFFSKWKKYYYKYRKEEGIIINQPSLRKALYESDVRIATLPSEYNCRFIYGGYVDRKAKIFHGRHKNIENIEKIVDKVNRFNRPRVYIYRKGSVRVIPYLGKSKVRKKIEKYTKKIKTWLQKPKKSLQKARKLF